LLVTTLFEKPLMARPTSTPPELQSHTTTGDSSETGTMLPAHLSVLQKNIEYVSPYQPITQESSKEIPGPASSSRASEPERNVSSKAIRSASKYYTQINLLSPSLRDEWRQTIVFAIFVQRFAHFIILCRPRSCHYRKSLVSILKHVAQVPFFRSGILWQTKQSSSNPWNRKMSTR
jgi:hypothetical protein